MYKCKECSKTYEKKPDYCECGNDTFIEAEENNRFLISPSYKKNLPSIIFLIFCIILSFVILFFVGNPKDKPSQNEPKKAEKTIDLPDIDDIWNDEKPKQIVKPKQEIIAPKQEQKPAIIKPVQEKAQNNAQKPQNSVLQKQKTQAKKPKTQNIQNQNTKIPSAKPQNPPQQVQKPKQQPPQPQQVQPQVQTQKPQIQNIQTSNPDEMKQYKKALRSKIASNIDFLSIAGDGKCSLSFSISQNGVLLNRKFVSQSQNTSLNDAVYQAMLRVSSFKTPPSGYKNETLKLTVQISGGNFTVSLE